MMTDGKLTDPPLVVNPGATPFGAAVIDLAEVRIRFGVRPASHRIKCGHSSVLYASDERRVWCEDCERTLDNFDAFMIFVKHFQAMERAAKGKTERAAAAEAAVLVRRVSKSIDRAWGRQMAVSCPHCRAGILPEDFGGHTNACSREIEIQRRKPKAGPVVKEPA